jgi:hypothetical protein
MGKKKNQTTDLSRQTDECRTDNLGTEQGNTGRMGKDNSKQSINNPRQRSGISDSTSSGRSSQLNERTGRADEEPVDENSEDLP